ncbi:MAG: hypothetical protein CMD11_02740 [Flavobacteriales bacterium]|nr:hypothetical protein [Flavobacteriales bacterium]|tara:strand:- start:2646 stop:3059 length:414 start_codon:yes stop_codon:yes gene_type:complete
MKEKNINALELKLMSIAHEILRNRKKLNLDKIYSKSIEIIDLIKSNEVTESKLDHELVSSVKEPEFESLETSFINSLFDGVESDYQRVISMLKSKDNFKNAEDFLKNNVIPDYDWADKEEMVNKFYSEIHKLYTKKN